MKTCGGVEDNLCNIYKMKSLSNILFIWHKYFTCKMHSEVESHVLYGYWQVCFQLL